MSASAVASHRALQSWARLRRRPAVTLVALRSISEAKATSAVDRRYLAAFAALDLEPDSSQDTVRRRCEISFVRFCQYASPGIFYYL